MPSHSTNNKKSNNAVKTVKQRTKKGASSSRTARWSISQKEMRRLDPGQVSDGQRTRKQVDHYQSAPSTSSARPIAVPSASSSTLAATAPAPPSSTPSSSSAPAPPSSTPSSCSAPEPPPKTFYKILGNQETISKEEVKRWMTKLGEFYNSIKDEPESQATKTPNCHGFVSIQRNMIGAEELQAGSTDYKEVGRRHYCNYIVYRLLVKAMEEMEKKRGTKAVNPDIIFHCIWKMFPTRAEPVEIAVMVSSLFEEFEGRLELPSRFGFLFKFHESALPYEEKVKNFDRSRNRFIKKFKEQFAEFSKVPGRTDEEKKMFKEEHEVPSHLIPVDSIRPCNHEGSCVDNPQCSCARNGMCTHLCQCSGDCPQRFPGCACAPGRCRDNKCKCFLSGWECNPLTCRECRCEKGANGNQDRCGNTRIRDGKPVDMEVKTSNIPNAGKGLFLKASVKANDFLCEYLGATISHEEGEHRVELDPDNDTYYFGAYGNGTIDAKHVGNLSRFANNSSKPNVRCVSRVVGVEVRIGFFALKDMAPGTEILVNYKYTKEMKKNKFKKN